MIDDDDIDLTEHRDFRERTISGFHMIHQDFENKSFWEELHKREQRRKFGGLPWNVYPENELYPYDGLVALGNAEQRKQTIEMSNWGTQNSIVCDCCGREYKKIPWKKNWGLCDECDEYYKTNREITFPWN